MLLWLGHTPQMTMVVAGLGTTTHAEESMTMVVAGLGTTTHAEESFWYFNLGKDTLPSSERERSLLYGLVLSRR